jgi:hypothetical protein
MVINSFQELSRRLVLAIKFLRYGDLDEMAQRDIPALSPEEVAEAKEFFPLDKFFIFGHARSGTTLLARLIRTHPDIHCNWQAHFFSRTPLLESLVASPEVTDWLSRRDNRWNRGQDLSPVVLRAVSDFILEREARRFGASVVGDKSPNSLLNGKAVFLANKVYPDGKIIFIIRDGRDAAISHRFQTFIDASQHLTEEDRNIRDSFERSPDYFLDGKRSIFSKGSLRRAAEGWVRNVKETDEKGKQLFGKNYCSLRYEDLLADPFQLMTQLWSFLGINTKSSMLKDALVSELSINPDKEWQQQKAKDLIEPIRKGSSGSWQNLFTETDRNIFTEIAGESLHNWGYEC